MKYKLIFASLVILSCGQNETNSDFKNEKHWNELYGTTRTFTIKNGILDSIVETKSISTDYLDMNLVLLAEQDSFIGEKKIQDPISMEDFKVVRLNVSDKYGEYLYFKSSTDFLNYMSSCGYEMASQSRTRYDYLYTFKRKQ